MSINQNLAASIVIQNLNNVWVNDHMVINCQNCDIEFSWWIRRHHCRNCGNIFCYKCTNKSIIIPNFIDRPDPAGKWNLSFYLLDSLKGNEEKVCDKCYDIIIKKNKDHNKIVTIFENPIGMDDINNLPESDIEIRKYYYERLRNIQYYLPNHQYDPIDKKILGINAVYFSKHSKYLMHYIKSIEWDMYSMTSNDQQSNFVLTILNNNQNKDCSELLCTRTCNEILSCDDCINILYSCSERLPNDILIYLFTIISSSSEQIILCYLSFFINLIKKNNCNKLLQTLIYKLLNQSDKLIHQTYWFLNNEKDSSNFSEIKYINDFIQLFDLKIIKKIHHNYTFFYGLIKNLDNPVKYLTDNFNHYKPIALPFDPTIELIDVDYESITIKNSHTRPIIINFQTNTGNKKILFKKESIINDIIVLNLISICDIILSETLKINFNAIVYNVIPISSRGGMIEIVDKAETIHTIRNSRKTIQQFILENNENRIVGEILSGYVYSLVSYTMHSYFIGLGDRHLENIMITDNGAIFHIDFGFILGLDTYPISASDIKLNSDMLDVIGGQDGRWYKLYLELCAKGVIILRKNFNIFYILFSQIQNNKFKERNIEKFIMSRFQPRQHDKVVISELISIIKQSHDAYSDLIKDFLHYHTQEKTVQNGVEKIIKMTVGLARNVTGSLNEM
uniref:FYVE-type domain-containing protein n=1 Tax=viral metagenome TaxID=1070528 RepID=A0A6C0LRB5_9ZZZZ